MGIDYIIEFYNFFKLDNIVLLYSGHFNDFVLLNTTDIVKKYENDKEFEKDKNKMIFLMIEAFQNVIRYADIDNKDENGLLSRLFIARKVGNEIFIATSNLIENYKKEELQNRIDNLNFKDQNELKELFLDVLINKEFSGKRGAGLGFIEMRRKTKINLDYLFDKFNDDLFYFYFLTKLNTNSRSICNMSIDDVKEIHHKFSKNRIVFFLKNNFNEETINSVLPVFQENIKGPDKNYQKLLFHLMVETLQNISKHAAEVQNRRDGVIVLSKFKNNFEIGSVNLIKKEDVDYLSNFLDDLKVLSKTELDTKFSQRLVDEDMDMIGGLGFIEIARESKNFNYKFYDYDEKYSFFAFTIKINFL